MMICFTIRNTEPAGKFSLPDELETGLHHAEGEPTRKPKSIDRLHGSGQYLVRLIAVRRPALIL